MSSLIRWEPINELVTLRDAMDRMFEESFVRPRASWIAPMSAATLAIDVYETKDDVVVKAALPGVKPEALAVTITGNTLNISGESKEENETKDQDMVRKELRYGSFSRTVTLPNGLKGDKADATFEHGMLTLKIPKAEEIKPKSIKVQAK